MFLKAPIYGGFLCVLCVLCGEDIPMVQWPTKLPLSEAAGLDRLDDQFDEFRPVKISVF